MPTKHARFGPSSLDALSRCIRFKYSDINEDAALEGTMLHKAAETGDLAGLDEDQAQDVSQVRAAVDALKNGPGTWLDFAEHKATLQDLTFGTADRVLINFEQGIVYVIDYKFTRVAGDHEFQARTYGAAVYEMMVEAERSKIKQVITYVIAPRLNIIEIGEYDPDELLARVRKDITELYKRIDNPWNPPTPHGDLCAKCARIVGCPAAGTTMLAVAKAKGLPLPSVFDINAPVTTTDRALVQAVAMLAENWSKEVKQKNTEFVKATGQDIPGFALRQRSTGARVDKTDTPLAVMMLKQDGFNEDEILQACKLSLNDLAKVHAETTTDTIRETKDRLKELLGAITREGVAEYLQKTKRVSEEQLIMQITQGVQL